MKRVLCVCLGNICRSPTAEAVLRRRAADAGIALTVDSAGTSAWHIGEPPDPRTRAAAAARGYDLSACRGRQVTRADFHSFDFLLAMDRENLRQLQAMAPATGRSQVQLFGDYLSGVSAGAEVPDPYYGGEDGFEQVLDLIEAASDSLLQVLQEQA